MSDLLRNRNLNGWRLFWLIASPVSLAVIIKTLNTDLSGGEGISDLIGYSVRWAVPFIYLVVAASAMPVLFPGPLSSWLMRNRKYLGLCFAVAMAWQGLFILIVSTVYREFYFEEIFAFRDELEGTFGYVFLAALTVTSFSIGRKRISSQDWKALHTFGVFYLWAYPFSVYWWALFYYPTLEPFNAPALHDYVFYVAGFAAMAARIAAWGKKRLAKEAGFKTPMWRKTVGGGAVALGLVLAVTGQLWREPVSAVLYGPTVSANAAEWLPFWPLEPFLPLLIMTLGVFVATPVYGGDRAKAATVVAAE